MFKIFEENVNGAQSFMFNLTKKIIYAMKKRKNVCFIMFDNL